MEQLRTIYRFNKKTKIAPVIVVVVTVIVALVVVVDIVINNEILQENQYYVEFTSCNVSRFPVC